MDILNERPPSSEKYVLFFDEFPWFDTPRSRFLAAFDFFWNHWASRQRNLIVVICGSAASWMLQHIVRNKGGLHNRLTRRIRLMPFTLHETELYLRARHVVLDRFAITQLYMAMGGIPQYLREVEPGDSVSQVLKKACFSREGWLIEEHRHLYAALFGDDSKHMQAIKALAAKPFGLTRNDLLVALNTTTGGHLSLMLEELEESGFVLRVPQFGKLAKFDLYRLDDEFSHFYYRFMHGSNAVSAKDWQSTMLTSKWYTWAGLAFERLCAKHIQQIKAALGISSVDTEWSVWQHQAAKGDGLEGAQIDMVIDRRDQIIQIVEIKFAQDIFQIDKAYSADLRRKRAIFSDITKSRKPIFLTFITPYGVRENEYYLGHVQSQVTLDALFEK